MNCIHWQTSREGPRDESPNKRASCRFAARPGVTHAGMAGGTLRYGYPVIDTTASNGSPKRIRRIVHERIAHTANTVPQFCSVNGAIVSILNMDGNRIVDPLTDGLLRSRAMKGLTGATVTNNAILAVATGRSSAQMRFYIDQHSSPTIGYRSLIKQRGWLR